MRVAFGRADVRATVEDEPRVGLVGKQVDDLAVALRGGGEHPSERVELGAGALTELVKSNSATPEKVALINPSPIVDLVESGTFLFSPDRTQAAVADFIDAAFERHPLIDVRTLSSTHLPWLQSFFETARPNCRFLDPALKIVAGIGDGTAGNGTARGLITDDANFDLETFQRMLHQIGVNIPL